MITTAPRNRKIPRIAPDRFDDLVLFGLAGLMIFALAAPWNQLARLI